MILRALVGLVLALALLCIWQRGSLASARANATMAEAELEAVTLELSAAQVALEQAHSIIATERAQASAANALAADYEKEKINAQAAHDQLVADLRAGNERLHARWQAAAATADLSAATAAASVADGGADDRIQSAGRAIGAAAVCDAQVRGLQAYALLCSGGAR